MTTTTQKTIISKNKYIIIKDVVIMTITRYYRSAPQQEHQDTKCNDDNTDNKSHGDHDSYGSYNVSADAKCVKPETCLTKLAVSGLIAIAVSVTYCFLAECKSKYLSLHSARVAAYLAPALCKTVSKASLAYSQ